MKDIFIYSAIAMFAFFASLFWLQKTSIKKATQKKTSFLFNGYTSFFYLIITTTFIASYFLLPNKDFITSLSISNIIIPLLSLGLLCIKPNIATQIIACIAISIFAPTQAVSNYFTITNPYITKAIIFLFLTSFSFLYQGQKRISGISFIELSALGATFLIIYLLKDTTKLYGIAGLVIASTSFAMYKFAKIPTKIGFSSGDSRFFGVFCGWFILLLSAEYGLYAATTIFAIFLINIAYQIFQKIFSLNLKQNFDFYSLSITQGCIDEQDLYEYTIKVYIIMTFIASSSVRISQPSNILIVAAAFGTWFLHRTYNLYQKKPTWKGLFNEIKTDIKENIKGGSDDKKA